MFLNLKKLVIGLGENKNIKKAVHKFTSDFNANVKIVTNSEDLINNIFDSNVDGVVRGSLPASDIITKLKNKYPNSNVNRSTFIEKDDYKFLIAPVGIDEAQNTEERLILARQCISFFEKLNIKPSVAVLANGRSDDYNRLETVDKSLNDSEILTKTLKKEYPEYNIKNYYILIEKALNDKCNVLLASDGIVGNIIFRTMVLVDKWPSMGAVTLGIPNVYIDTSRDQSAEVYYRSLKLAYNLSEKTLQSKLYNK